MPADDLIDQTLLRIRYRTAANLIVRLRGDGCTLRLDGEKVLISPGSKLSDDDKRLVKMLRDEVIELLRGEK